MLGPPPTRCGGVDTSFTLSIKPRTGHNLMHAASECISGPVWWRRIGLSLHLSSNQGDEGPPDQYLILEHSGRLCVCGRTWATAAARCCCCCDRGGGAGPTCVSAAQTAGWAHIDFVISGWTGWVKMAPAKRLTRSSTTDVTFNIHVAPRGRHASESKACFRGNSCSR